jgi:predicted ABC-type transport system involved in lysophospholipase L1 biosynthesis ATPase subunit
VIQHDGEQPARFGALQIGATRQRFNEIGARDGRLTEGAQQFVEGAHRDHGGRRDLDPDWRAAAAEIDDETGLAEFRSHNVGFIFQFYNLIPVLTATENVELPLLLTHLSKAERRERATTALKVVGLADRAGHYPRQLSGGQEQRVAIARAIGTDPKVLVADEPTGDLDAKSATEILDLMGALNRDFKKTIVMVTHDPRAAERAHTQHHLEKGVLRD